MKIRVDVDLCRGCEACELVCLLIHEGESNPQLSRVQVQKDLATYPFKINLSELCQLIGQAPECIPHQRILIDSLLLCDFAFPQVVRPLKDSADWHNNLDISGDLDIDRRLLMAVTGQDWTREELTYIAERAFTLERLMLACAGRSRADGGETGTSFPTALLGRRDADRSSRLLSPCR